MKEVHELFTTLWNTKVLNENRFIFIAYFILTHVVTYSLRRFYKFGVFLLDLSKKLPGKIFVIKNKGGVWEVTPFNDTMTISADYFEKKLKPWVQDSEHKNIFIDIGAHIGKYTLLALNVANFSEVISVEANPTTYKYLLSNLSLNNLQSKVTAINIAVGNTLDKVKLNVNPEHLGGATISSDPMFDSMKEHFSVQITTMDKILNENSIDVQRISFIKMDVENMEYEVLDGMKETLGKVIPGTRLMVEISTGNTKAETLLTSLHFRKIDSCRNDALFIKVAPQNHM